MSGAIFPGDEVGSLVVEVGGYSTKAGFAGEESPSIVLPTDVGYIEKDSKRNYYIGTNKICVPREGMEVTNPITDGEITDWDAYENILTDVFENQLRCNVKHHPVMLGDEAWSTRKQREKLTEIMFEKYEVPAYYLMRKAVLSAFASGKSTALVFDVGLSGASAVPVYDGYVLNKGIQRSKLGGNYLIDTCNALLKEKNIDVIPKYEVLKKGLYDEHRMKRNKYTASKIEASESYRRYYIRSEILDFYQSVSQVSDTVLDESALLHIPTVGYEFSTGVEHQFGSERFRICESLFKDNGDPASIAIPNLIGNSITSCDVDIRQNLWNNVIVTGGLSLTTGFTERLNSSLYSIQQDGKLKVSFSATSYERQYSAWIGGSILASLGAFQQRWISKQEYEESGKCLVEKKCP